MNQNNKPHCSAKTLHPILAGCHVTQSPLSPGGSLDGLMDEVTSCQIIKETNRRQVYHLRTPTKGYFLKLSTLARKKDRRRHFFLPNRKWAEWRNLHRLLLAEIPAAIPVLKGENKATDPEMFFLLTEEIQGEPFSIKSAADARKIGNYAATLHSHGVYHTDLNRNNIIVTPEGRFRLIDVQEVIFLPWIPHRLRVHNLGRILFNFYSPSDPEQWAGELLKSYNKDSSKLLDASAVFKAAGRHQQRKYRSRARRCCKNSTEFVGVKKDGLKGYRRRSFHWDEQDLRQALENGQPLKGSHVIHYQGVCVKKHPRRFLRDRCLTSWKMSRALEVRGIEVPRSLAYYVMDKTSHFIAELLVDRVHLNTFLSALSDEGFKRRALQKLALWLRKFHDTHVWQRDFKSSNILCQNGDYYMVDLDGVRICRLSEHNKIYNLAQLNASVSNAITIKDRLRFYHYYSAGRQLTRPQRRAVYRKVWDITRTKNTALYDLFPEKFKLNRAQIFTDFHR
jgi:tRNA A-37 threonylcarbamoyl transferase component Bud32